MKITKLETFATPAVAFTRITAADGSTGWGQLSTYHADITALVFHRQVAPHALGRNTDDLDYVLGKIPEHEHKFPGSYLYRALGGLDTAIWDWRGKQAGLPVTSLLGGNPGALRAYASSMKRDITPDDEARRFATLRDRFGFDAFKFRVGAETGRDVDEWPGRTEQIVPTIRRALGEGVTLLVDANSGFSPGRAIEVGKLLQDNGVVHFEEPCPYWEMEQTKQVTDALTLDVTGGEQDWDIHHWRRMIDMKAVDVIQPDVMYMGGVTRMMQVAAMAAQAGMLCTPHCANWSLVTLFTMHVLRALPNAGPYLEFSIEGADYYPWQYGLFTHNPYQITNGQAMVSDAPGWGVEIHPDWLARATYQCSAL